jgi:hypothetical protein
VASNERESAGLDFFKRDRAIKNIELGEWSKFRAIRQA